MLFGIGLVGITICEVGLELLACDVGGGYVCCVCRLAGGLCFVIGVYWGNRFVGTCVVSYYDVLL